MNEFRGRLNPRASGNIRGIRSACARKFFLATVAFVLPLGAVINAPSWSQENPTPSPEQQIAKLIQQLGSDQFAVREKAHSQLERLGLKAFDALYHAQNDPDIEIALRARYLVRSMKIRWAQEEDPASVKRILRGYADLDDDDRKNRMDRLIALEGYQGLPIVCRLVRYEASGRLAKQGTLLVMNQSPIAKPADRIKVAKMIRDATGRSDRVVVQWLLAYADILEVTSSLSGANEHNNENTNTNLNLGGLLDRWESLIAAERERLNQSPQDSDRDVVRDLFRWQSDLLARHDRIDQSKTVIRKLLDLLEDDREELADAVDWLMEKQSWEMIGEVAQRFSATFSGSNLLSYRLAEAQRKQGKNEQADQTADKAFKIDPDEMGLHLQTAFSLQDRGLFDWSEREYRHVMANEKVGSRHDLYARFLLSEMLHDQLKELDAATVLKAAVDVFEKDPNVLRNVAAFDRDPGGVRSRMHYFFANHFENQGDRDKQREHLRFGAKHDPNDSDVLIAMHRLPDPDMAWKVETRGLIEKSAQYFLAEIRKYEQAAEQAPRAADHDAANRKLATACNQYAWLVSNTVGDYDEAVRRSHQSLELRPDSAGFLDTLGRCYYANKDYENAVKYQRQAVKLDPHSVQILRQLELFEKALAGASPADAATNK